MYLSKTISKSVLFALSCGALMFSLPETTSSEPNAPTLSPGQQQIGPAVYTKDGQMLRPKGYRSWVFVGAPLTPNDMNAGSAAFPEFHSVYVDPESYETYKHTGKWREGTVLLKELISVGSKAASSGKGYFMGDFQGLEAAVKSSELFPDSSGNWGFFRFTNEEDGALHKLAAALPPSACATCHVNTAAEDSVFTQYYPVLRAAKNFGAGQPED